MASLGELVIELGVLGDDEGAKKVAKAIDDAIKKTDKYAKAVKELEKKKRQEIIAEKEQIKTAIEKERLLAKQDKLQELRDKRAEKAAEKRNKKIIEFSEGIAGLITAVGAAIFALDKLTQSLVNQNQYWINLTRNSDIALSTYQKWGQVGAAMNASLGEMGAAGALADLNEKLFELKLTGQGARGFQLAGIMPTNAEDVLEQLRDRIKGLNDTSATYLLKQMGIDPRMLSVLRMTREEFNSLTKELEKYQLTMEQRQQIQEFHKQMSIVNVKMQYFKDRILLKILPHFLNFMRNLEFITEGLFKLAKVINKVTGNWKPLIAVALVFIAKIKPIAKFLTVINTAFVGLISKIPIFGKFIAGLGGILGRAFLPLTALYLLIDDVRAFVQGGGSMIGVMLYGFKKIQDVINFETPEWIKNLVYVASKMPNIVEGVQAIRDIKEGKDVKVNAPELALAPIRLVNPAANLVYMGAKAAAQSYITNNNNNTSNQVNQTINIETNQPAAYVKRDLTQTLSNFQ